MKNFVLVLVLFFTIPLYSQSVQWGTTSDIDVDLRRDYAKMYGKYLGSINDQDIYVHYDDEMDDYYRKYTISISVVSALQLKSTTKPIELIGKMHNISLIDDKIAILYYFKESKETQTRLMVNYYDISSLKLVKSDKLYEFVKVNQYIPYVHYAQSEDQSKHGIIIDLYNGKMEYKKLKFLVYDQNFSLMSEKEITTDENYEIIFKNSCISNSGILTAAFYIDEGIVYKGKNRDANGNKIDEDDPKYFPEMEKNIFFLFDGEEIKTLTVKAEKFENDQFILTVNDCANQKIIAIFKDETKICCYLLNFDEETTSKIYENLELCPNNRIEKVIRYKDGTNLIVLSNFGYAIPEKSSIAATMVVPSILLWRNNYKLIGFQDDGTVEFETMVGSVYSLAVYNYVIFENLFYISQFIMHNDKLYIVHNTDPEITESPSTNNFKENKPKTVSTTKNIQSRLTIIDSKGSIETKQLYNQKNDEFLLIPTFCILRNPGEIQLTIGTSDKIGIGKMSF
jgi:hypothetical protein